MFMSGFTPSTDVEVVVNDLTSVKEKIKDLIQDNADGHFRFNWEEAMGVTLNRRVEEALSLQPGEDEESPPDQLIS